jgi:acetyl esterase/lipase
MNDLIQTTNDLIHPWVDPDFREVLELSTNTGRVATPVSRGATSGQINDIRSSYLSVLPSVEDMRRNGKIEATEFLLPDETGADTIPALLLRPAGVDGALPVIFYTANGGKIVQSVAVGMSDTELDWVEKLGVAMMIVACRVGPENPHPAQVEDNFRGLTWMAEHASELNLDMNRVMIYGKSGGGGVAAATALYNRDHGGPEITHQILIYPMMDDREDDVSSQFEGVVWDRQSNRTGWTAILGDKVGGPDVSEYAAAARATDLRGLPATYIEVGAAEVFRDESILYAHRLGEVGIPTELHVWAGGLHAFELMLPEVPMSQQAIAARTNYVQRALRQPE